MVPIDGNLLILLRKNFLYPKDSRQPNRSLSGPFDSKGKFFRSGKTLAFGDYRRRPHDFSYPSPEWLLPT